MSPPALENGISDALAADLSKTAAPLKTPIPVRDVPKTNTLATQPIGNGFAAGASPLGIRPAEGIRADAADKVLETARAEHERARKAINAIELARQMARAEALEKFRVRAEELMAEREQELTRIENDAERRAAAPLALLRVTGRLVEPQSEGGAKWAKQI